MWNTTCYAYPIRRTKMRHHSNCGPFFRSTDVAEETCFWTSILVATFEHVERKNVLLLCTQNHNGFKSRTCTQQSQQEEGSTILLGTAKLPLADNWLQKNRLSTVPSCYSSAYVHESSYYRTKLQWLRYISQTLLGMIPSNNARLCHVGIKLKPSSLQFSMAESSPPWMFSAKEVLQFDLQQLLCESPVQMSGSALHLTMLLDNT